MDWREREAKRNEISWPWARGEVILMYHQIHPKNRALSGPSHFYFRMHSAAAEW